MRLLTRIGAGLGGILVGLLVADLVLPGVSLSATGLIEATLVFWVVLIVVSFVGLRAVVNEPTIRRVVLMPLLVTVAALVITSILVDGLHIDGVLTYVWTGAILWIATGASQGIGHRIDRNRRRDQV